MRIRLVHVINNILDIIVWYDIRFASLFLIYGPLYFFLKHKKTNLKQTTKQTNKPQTQTSYQEKKKEKSCCI